MKPPHVLMLLLLLPACLTAGCAGGGSTVYLNDGVTRGRPVFFGTVTVYAAREINRPVEEMGSICVTISDEVPGGEFIKRMQKEAAGIGANAVVAYEQWGRSAVGIAVRFKEGQQGAAPAHEYVAAGRDSAGGFHRQRPEQGAQSGP